MKSPGCGPRVSPSGRRQGYTLIEMMVVISLLGVLLPTTGWMLHTLMKVELASRHEQARQQTLLHLGEVFRRDIRLSTTANSNDDARELTLTDPEGNSIRYRIDDFSIERRELGTGETAVHRERFLLPECVVRLDVAATNQGTIWSLIVQRPAIRLTQSSELRGRGLEFPIRATLNVNRLPPRIP